jgi:hypothetical protein
VTKPGRAGGGTSVPDKTVWWPWLVPLAAGPVAGYIVKDLSAGNMCTWDYGAMGGACRAILLIAVIVGVVVAVFSWLFARGLANDRTTLAITFGILTPLVVVLGIAGGTQFAHYQASVGGGTEMEEGMCTWVRETLPACIETVWGPSEAETVRTAQPTCYADRRSIENYARCMKLTDCKQIIDCVAGRR